MIYKGYLNGNYRLKSLNPIKHKLLKKWQRVLLVLMTEPMGQLNYTFSQCIKFHRKRSQRKQKSLRRATEKMPGYGFLNRLSEGSIPRGHDEGEQSTLVKGTSIGGIIDKDRNVNDILSQIERYLCPIENLSWQRDVLLKAIDQGQKQRKEEPFTQHRTL